MRYIILKKESTSEGTECKFEEYNSLEETLHRFNSLANISDNSNCSYIRTEIKGEKVTELEIVKVEHLYHENRK